MGDVAGLRRWLVACALAALFALLPSVAGAAAPAQVPATGWKPLLLRGTGLERLGTHLYLDGSPYRFTGVNAYELATDWSVNLGCGSEVTDLDALFHGLPAGSVIRFWAFQSLAVDKHTHSFDFVALDRVVAAAAARHDLLIMTLSDQAGTCDDGHFHSESWYEGGYRARYADAGMDRDLVSYARWVHDVVYRYRQSPTIGMWEPVNEAEASDCAPGYTGSGCFGHTTCPAGATAALRRFFDAVGGQIHQLDPGTPVAAGLQGGQQCGVAGQGFAELAASPGIDVLTYHDYGAAGQPLPAELGLRIRQAAAAGKPFFVEEAGISAGQAPGCPSLAQRAQLMAAKVSASFAHGVDGWLPWDWVPAPATGCSYDIGLGDPVLSVLGHAVASSATRLSPALPPFP